MLADGRPQTLASVPHAQVEFALESELVLRSLSFSFSTSYAVSRYRAVHSRNVARCSSSLAWR